MTLAARIRRTWWAALRRLGLQALSWDRQYHAGIWDRGGRSPHTVKLTASLCAGGRLLEFGCGTGTLPHLLPAGSCSEYVGFDISRVAIERARLRAVEAQLPHVTFEQLDMAHWRGDREVALILAEECLYYLGSQAMERFLHTCQDSLTRTGRILVVVHSASRHASTLETCRRCGPTREETVGTRLYLQLGARSEAPRLSAPPTA